MVGRSHKKRLQYYGKKLLKRVTQNISKFKTYYAQVKENLKTGWTFIIEPVFYWGLIMVKKSALQKIEAMKLEQCKGKLLIKLKN